MNPARNTKSIGKKHKISNGVKVSIKDLQKRIPVNTKRMKEAVLETLSREGIKKSGEITVCFVSDSEIKTLNLMYLGRNNATDVLAFNLTNAHPRGVHRGAENILADIAISTDRAIDNARAFNTKASFELYLYVIHGVLHILGYDDKTKPDRLLMHKKERQILKTLDLSS